MRIYNIEITRGEMSFGTSDRVCARTPLLDAGWLRSQGEAQFTWDGFSTETSICTQATLITLQVFRGGFPFKFAGPGTLGCRLPGHSFEGPVLISLLVQMLGVKLPRVRLRQT